VSVPAPRSPQALLEATGVHVSYGESRVIFGIDVCVQAGETVALLGRNGAGKTTLIRALFGLLRPKAGRMVIDGSDVTGSSPDRIALAGLALVPEGRGIFPNLTVKENLVMAARPGFGGEQPWSLPRVLALFPQLAERLQSFGDRLSGGEQQMLAIGRALMTNPRLLVLDEATEGLAPRVRQRIWSVMATIKAAGIATLIVDRDLTDLLAIADRCYILARGVVVYDGPSAELVRRPEIHVRHLGV
jgi:branched-chain amino acid transport system ATP-binding protein